MKHITNNYGSNFAIFAGALLFFYGINQLNSGLVSGPTILIGAFAYKSAKKRKLQVVPDTFFRKLFELMGFILILLMIIKIDNVNKLIFEHPIPLLVIPIWAISAYLFILFKK
jgi:hypothetical protein